jgi:nucleotide-binding universal stress UspA family protein
MQPWNVVVVGVDGSPESGAALGFAVAEAHRRGAVLQVIVAYEPPLDWAAAYGLPVPGSAAQLRADILGQTRRAVDRVLATDPAPPRVDIIARVGPAARVLVAAAERADLLVLGHHGRGGYASMLIGSVCLECLVHAPCPVTVVPPPVVTDPVPNQAMTASTAGPR